MLRTWRVLLLAWAVLLAPQLSLVHALSHIASQSATRSADERQQAPDKVCDTCLATAQLASALTSHFEWHGPADKPAAPLVAALRGVTLPPITHFLARAPPPALI
jgi:hypothetical protein